MGRHSQIIYFIECTRASGEKYDPNLQDARAVPKISMYKRRDKCDCRSVIFTLYKAADTVGVIFSLFSPVTEN